MYAVRSSDRLGDRHFCTASPFSTSCAATYIALKIVKFTSCYAFEKHTDHIQRTSSWIERLLIAPRSSLDYSPRFCNKSPSKV